MNIQSKSPLAWLIRPFDPGHRVGRLVAVVLLTVVLVTLSWAAVGIWKVARQPSLPPLTRDDFEAAGRRWQQHGPANYDVDLVLHGDQQGTVHVEVRRGEVTQMLRDGVAPKRRGAWDYWSVPGQLDVIEVDLDTAQRGADQLVLRAVFDPELGYPSRYQRIDLVSRHEAGWEVRRFVRR